MYADAFDYNDTIIIKTYTTSGLQNTKVETTIYSGACFAYRTSRASNYQDGIRLNDIWQIGINPANFSGFNYDLSNAQAYLNGGTKPYQIENADNPGSYNDIYLITIYRTGNNG